MTPLFISSPELFFILFVAVLLFGTDKIPEIARSFGKGMRQLKDATSEIKNEINKSVENTGIDTSVINEVKDEIEKDEALVATMVANIINDSKIA